MLELHVPATGTASTDAPAVENTHVVVALGVNFDKLVAREDPAAVAQP